MAVPYHIPALLQETVGCLAIKPSGCYVDLTFGGGGHSRAILDSLSPAGRLFSFDQDDDAWHNALADPFWQQHPNWQFVHGNFRYLRQFLDYYGVAAYNTADGSGGVDGILADLGVSFHHFDDAARGFSFRYDAPLDMKMNRTASRNAADILNQYDEQRLADIFYLYGELKNSRRLAQLIVRQRAVAPVSTTADLLTAVAKGRFSVGSDGSIELDPALKKDTARLFQALRIEVNDELAALREMLSAATLMLRPGAPFVILTYHSLEDRIVKNFFRTGNTEGSVNKDFYGNVLSPFSGRQTLLTASEDEVAANPRARSAKLRAAIKN